MPGINFGTYGGVSTRSQASTSPMPQSATAAAFGPGYTSTNPDALSAALMPNDAFGISFWVGIVSVVGLVVIRHSLPR